jgi:RNA polymerase sigma-70 factor, ECF subfamily
MPHGERHHDDNGATRFFNSAYRQPFRGKSGKTVATARKIAKSLPIWKKGRRLKARENLRLSGGVSRSNLGHVRRLVPEAASRIRGQARAVPILRRPSATLAIADKLFVLLWRICHLGIMDDILERIARDRDPQAFRELFSLFGPRVKAMMMRQGADAAAAEDIAQETLFMVWRKAHLFAAQKGSVSTWVYTIARNLRIDRLRRQIPFQHLPSEFLEVPSDDDLPDETLNRDQQRERIRKVMENLPPEQYEVVRLSYIEGLSHNEIAGALNAPLGTVKSRMRLAYEKIREAVGEDA